MSISHIKKSISEWIKQRNEIIIEKEREGENFTSIDKSEIFAISPCNFRLMVRQWMRMLEPMNPKNLPADDPSMFSFKELIYYNLDGKEMAVCITLPLSFVGGDEDCAIMDFRRNYETENGVYDWYLKPILSEVQ